MLPAEATDERFLLYKKYQVSVHGDNPETLTIRGFHRFLVESPIAGDYPLPLTSTPPHIPSPPPEGQGSGSDGTLPPAPPLDLSDLDGGLDTADGDEGIIKYSLIKRPLTYPLIYSGTYPRIYPLITYPLITYPLEGGLDTQDGDEGTIIHMLLYFILPHTLEYTLAHTLEYILS